MISIGHQVSICPLNTSSPPEIFISKPEGTSFSDTSTIQTITLLFETSRTLQTS